MGVTPRFIRRPAQRRHCVFRSGVDREECDCPAQGQGLGQPRLIGVQIQPVTADIADSLGLKKAEGALVAEPQANGPAAKAASSPAT